MGVSESWAHDRVSDAELSLRGYDLYRCDRPSGHRGAGVLLYVKSSLSSVQFVTRANFPEQVWCKLIVESGSELLVGVCYRSPTNSISDDSHEVLRKVVKEFSDRNVILMRDFNYPDINWPTLQASSEASKQFVNVIEECYLVQHVTEPMRHGALLDLLIVVTHP